MVYLWYSAEYWSNYLCVSKLAEATEKNHIKWFRGSPKDKEHVYTNIYTIIKLPKISEKEKLLKMARVDKRGEVGGN